MRPWVLRGLIPLLILMSCPGWGAAQIGADSAVRDSAGIRIVENVVPAWEDEHRWLVRPEPQLELGDPASGPGQQFHHIAGVVRLENGELVVADGGSSELRFFDSEGVLIRTAGRAGDGPDEFNELVGLFRLAGDTLAAHDLRGRRVQLFTPEGRHLRSVQLRDPAPDRATAVLGLVDSGSLVFSEYVRPTLGPGEVRRPEVSYGRTDPEGRPSIRRIATINGASLYGRGGAPPVGLALGARPQVLVAGSTLVVGLPEGYEIRLYELDGGLVNIVRRDWSTTQVDDELVDTYVAGYLSRVMEAGTPAPMINELRDHLENTTRFADELPALSRLLRDSEGNLWARQYEVEHGLPLTDRYPTFSSPTRWDVFDAEGRWLGDVVTPPNFHVFEIGSDHLIGLARDELGVEIIRVLPLTKP